MNRKINVTITAVFLVLIFGFGAAFWILPDADPSPSWCTCSDGDRLCFDRLLRWF